MKNRAAVVIGVDRTGGLTPLKSAAAGAEQVATWLRREGYDVECLTDKGDGATVSSGDVETAIAKFVTKPTTYHFLLVYFSGHGYWHARSDRWLLSGAPTKTSDAINLDGAMDLAKYSGVPNVVFVSDACRSIPDSRQGSLVTGIDGFPNFGDITDESDIDSIRATSEARPAYENDFDGNPESVLTRAWVSAYKQPDAEMVLEVTEGDQTFDVVPNRRLKDYLQDEVDAILGAININLSQKLQVRIPSDDDIYIAKVQGTTRGVTRGATRGAAPTREDLGRDASRAALSVVTLGDTGVVGTEVEAEIQRRLPSASRDRFETEVGFTVQGARIGAVAAAKGTTDARAEIVEMGDGMDVHGVIRMHSVHPAATVAIVFEDGRCAIVPALNGYVGHILVDRAGVANVGYVPSANNYRYHDYERQREKIDRLRSIVAVAVDHGTFSLSSSEGAASLADSVRVGKGLDPSLGLYAAQAYSQAGVDREVVSVMDFMRDDLNATIFDVHALASRARRGESNEHLTIVPFCPALTQTWNVLRPRGIELPKVLADAAPELCDSLWTTFHPEAGAKIISAIEREELK